MKYRLIKQKNECRKILNGKVYVYQAIMLYTLKLYSDLCQVFLNKIREKKEQ